MTKRSHERGPTQPGKPTEGDHEENYSESGVDRTLIRWMLSMTPSERLRAMQEQLNAVTALKEQLDQD